jgi:hypothetical protein
MWNPSMQEVVDAFNATWAAHDLDAAVALVTDACLFDATVNGDVSRARRRARGVKGQKPAASREGT